MVDLKNIISNTFLRTQSLNIGISSCLLGTNCNYKGENNLSPLVKKIFNHSKTNSFLFCPEESTLGTPRDPVNIVGGDGHDVLNGKALCITHSGTDITDKMVKGAQNTLKKALNLKTHIFISMEKSPSCGLQNIYNGKAWPDKELTSGPGVTSALLIKNKIIVISHTQKDHLNLLLNSLEE